MKNPFIAGNWVRGENFFGRTGLLQEILEGTNKYLWVAGTRRFGKTSLLKQIEFMTTQPEYNGRYISLFWNMQGAANLGGLIESLLESFEDAEERFENIGIKIDDLEGKTISEIIRLLKRHARQENLTLLLLCDECEELINIEKENPETMPKLRRIFQQGENMVTVISATKRLSRLERSSHPETSPFLHGFIPPLYLKSLEDTEAERLIGRGEFDPPLVREIMTKCNNHPYLIQLFCKRLFDNRNLELVIHEMIDDDMIAHFFKVDFDYLEDQEKIILWHILSAEQISPEDLQKKTGIRFDNLAKLLYGLIQLGYLWRGNGEVRISNYFFEKWLKREEDQLFEGLLESPPSDSGIKSVLRESAKTSFVGKTVSHFQILEQLGSGGMGMVFKALDQRLDRIVALKMLAPGKLSEPEFRQRFFLEAKTCSSLNHSNIAVIYEVDEAFEQPFIAMEYIDGETLGEWRLNHQNEFAALVDVAIQIAEGLNCAHHHKIVHRDIKPDNIMVTGDNLVKITDFGLAKIIKDSEIKLTKTGTMLGTIAYMSPEQASGIEVDHRSDIFSYGVVLYELFTSRLPFDSQHYAALIYAIIHDEPPPAREINPALPPLLEKILGKLLQKEREERYQNMEEVIEELKRVTIQTRRQVE